MGLHETIRNLNTLSISLTRSINLSTKSFHENASPQSLFLAGYGMTETSPGITTSPAVGWKDGSGGVANPMTQVKVVDIETGATLGPNQEGEICCLGPQNMKGYLNNDKATRQTVDPDGWLHTGEREQCDF